jgi:hypothetical protein
MMGLLDMASPQQKMQQPQPQMMGGLLDMGSNQQNTAEKDMSIKLAQQVAENPTPETVNLVIKQLQENNMQNAEEISAILMQIQNEPEKLTQFAQTIINELAK